MPCVLLSKVLHMHVTLAGIQSALHSILWSFFVFSLGWGFLCFMLTACCWFFCQILFRLTKIESTEKFLVLLKVYFKKWDI
jgi:hypothetical protein